MTHECEPSNNPRHEGYCDCGHAVTATAEVELRDREFERQLTKEVGAPLGVDTTALSVYAERRADAHALGDVFPEAERRLHQEGIEELLDCRNYIVWELERIHRDLREPGADVPHLQMALKYVVLAFDALSQAQRGR